MTFFGGWCLGNVGLEPHVGSAPGRPRTLGCLPGMIAWCSSGLDRFTSSWSQLQLAGWLAKVSTSSVWGPKGLWKPAVTWEILFFCGSVLIFLTFRNFLCRFLSPRYYGVPWLKCTYGWGPEMIGAGPPKSNANRTCINHQLIQSFALPEVLPNLPTLSLSLSFLCFESSRSHSGQTSLIFLFGWITASFFFPIHDIHQ